MNEDLISLFRQCYRYDPLDGSLHRIDTRNGRPPNKVRASDRLCIDGKLYHINDVIWALVHNVIPEGRVYCANGDRKDRSITNLTLVKPRQKRGPYKKRKGKEH